MKDILKKVCFPLFLLGLMLIPRMVFAGTDITFDDMTMMLTDWTEGSLGKGFAILALLFGVGMAAVRQSFIALFSGIGVALGATIGPGILDNMFTAIF
jgi:conjugal transfer pilus assembly protein TraA